MPHSFGLRSKTRHLFARNFREHGPTKLSTYLKTYKVGDIVDIAANASIHKGMPHKFYQGYVCLLPIFSREILIFFFLVFKQLAARLVSSSTSPPTPSVLLSTSASATASSPSASTSASSTSSTPSAAMTS